MNGEDILFAMTSLGFENYAEALKIYLTKYREVSGGEKRKLANPVYFLCPFPKEALGKSEGAGERRD